MVLGTEPGMAGHSPLLSPLLQGWGIMAETGSLPRLVAVSGPFLPHSLPSGVLSPKLIPQHVVGGSPTVWGPGASVKEQGSEVRTGALSSGGHHRGGCSVPLGHQTENLVSCAFKAETKGGVDQHHLSPAPHPPPPPHLRKPVVGGTGARMTGSTGFLNLSPGGGGRTLRGGGGGSGCSSCGDGGGGDGGGCDSWDGGDCCGFGGGSSGISTAHRARHTHRGRGRRGRS